MKPADFEPAAWILTSLRLHHASFRWKAQVLYVSTLKVRWLTLPTRLKRVWQWSLGKSWSLIWTEVFSESFPKSSAGYRRSSTNPGPKRVPGIFSVVFQSGVGHMIAAQAGLTSARPQRPHLRRSTTCTWLKVTRSWRIPRNPHSTNRSNIYIYIYIYDYMWLYI